MKILVSGRGSGSWEIRGRQLGEAIGAHVDAHANDVRGYDLAIVVKRPRLDVLARLAHRKIPVVWDIVDAWPQPEGNGWSREQCMVWLACTIADIKPAAIVAPTRQMAADCEPFGVPVLALPHHANPALRRNPINPKIERVGYSGGRQYLDFWEDTLGVCCRELGWQFIHTDELARMDIVVALRAQQGYAARHWKSNVKLANAQGTGTPCVLGRECGYEETSCGAERWVDTREQLYERLVELAPHAVRQEISARLLKAAPSIESIARTYRQWLQGLKF